MDSGDWPPITHPQTLARLAAPDAALLSFLPDLMKLMPQLIGADDPAGRVQEALTYPWERPTAPCVLHGGEVHPDQPIQDGLRRWPMLAIGANASPWRLAIKFRDIDPAPIRLVPATLSDHDIVAAPVVTGYGSVPAILVESPGTQVRVALTWMTEPQVEALVLSEFGYHFGRLDGIRVVADDGVEHSSALAFAGRIGVYRSEPGGSEPVALAAIPAQARRYRALTQRELLEELAVRLAVEGGSDGLLSIVFDDMPTLAGKHYPTLVAGALPMPLSSFTPHPLR